MDEKSLQMAKAMLDEALAPTERRGVWLPGEEEPIYADGPKIRNTTPKHRLVRLIWDSSKGPLRLGINALKRAGNKNGFRSRWYLEKEAGIWTPPPSPGSSKTLTPEST